MPVFIPGEAIFFLYSMLYGAAFFCEISFYYFFSVFLLFSLRPPIFIISCFFQSLFVFFYFLLLILTILTYFFKRFPKNFTIFFCLLFKKRKTLDDYESKMKELDEKMKEEQERTAEIEDYRDYVKNDAGLLRKYKILCTIRRSKFKIQVSPFKTR